MAPVRAFRQISHERLAHELVEARQIASRRSGARGLKARKVVVILEEKLSASQRKVEEKEDVDPAVQSEETKAAVELLAGIQFSLEMVNTSPVEARRFVMLTARLNRWMQQQRKLKREWYC